MSKGILKRFGLTTNPDHDALILALSAIALLIIAGSVVFHRAEQLNRFDSVYFAMVSVSTIGYGDIVPHTTAGKIVTMVYSMTGVPLFIFTAGLFVERRLNAIVKHYISDQNEQLADIEDDINEIEEELEELGGKWYN